MPSLADRSHRGPAAGGAIEPWGLAGRGGGADRAPKAGAALRGGGGGGAWWLRGKPGDSVARRSVRGGGGGGAPKAAKASPADAKGSAMAPADRSRGSTPGSAHRCGAALRS